MDRVLRCRAYEGSGATCHARASPALDPTAGSADPIDSIDVTMIVASHFSPGLVYNLPYVGKGIKLCDEVQDTAPEFASFGISFTNDVS